MANDLGHQLVERILPLARIISAVAFLSAVMVFVTTIVFAARPMPAPAVVLTVVLITDAALVIPLFLFAITATALGRADSNERVTFGWPQVAAITLFAFAAVGTWVWLPQFHLEIRDGQYGYGVGGTSRFIVMDEETYWLAVLESLRCVSCQVIAFTGWLALFFARRTRSVAGAGRPANATFVPRIGTASPVQRDDNNGSATEASRYLSPPARPAPA